MNEIATFSSLYENIQMVLGKPTIYEEKITHFSAGGLGATVYSDDISIGELAKCWQYEEYHIKCRHCGEVAYITQWAGHANSEGYWVIQAYCPHCGKEYRYEQHTASRACKVHWTTLKNILQEEREAIQNEIDMGS